MSFTVEDIEVICLSVFLSISPLHKYTIEWLRFKWSWIRIHFGPCSTNNSREQTNFLQETSKELVNRRLMRAMQEDVQWLIEKVKNFSLELDFQIL